MTDNEFAVLRKTLGKTQKKLAVLLGTSIKAVHSYEQGWRPIPLHVERQLYFLLARKDSSLDSRKPCWKIKKCSHEEKLQCPAWEFRAGRLCWFINGTMCGCTTHKSWEDKIRICRKCEAFTPIVSQLKQPVPEKTC